MNQTVLILHPLTEHATPFPPNSPQVHALVERTMDWERNAISSSARIHSDHPVGSTSATCERYAQEGLWPSGVPGVFLSATPGENKFPPVATPKNIEPSRSSVKPEVRFAERSLPRFETRETHVISVRPGPLREPTHTLEFSFCACHPFGRLYGWCIWRRKYRDLSQDKCKSYASPSAEA